MPVGPLSVRLDLRCGRENARRSRRGTPASRASLLGRSHLIAEPHGGRGLNLGFLSSLYGLTREEIAIIEESLEKKQ